jgi:hypothetical protein
MSGEKGARGEGARERHDAASPNHVLQRGDVTREGQRDRGDACEGRCGEGGATGRG